MYSDFASSGHPETYDMQWSTDSSNVPHKVTQWVGAIFDDDNDNDDDDDNDDDYDDDNDDDDDGDYYYYCNSTSSWWQSLGSIYVNCNPLSTASWW